MLLIDLFENTKSLQLPTLETGDEILGGKFKNRKMVIKSFKKDDKNQPVAATNKGDVKLLKVRIPKLYDEK
jgi:hypothetical protein